uniref:tetratricopeptide repeat protein n=1 Tax=Bradyrhizobium sp. (strain ORS 278) TaxID=114615 RepID=UPI00059FB93A|nr:SEL1-like repeat protein [Bradyrhizobium sp. ORS 278]
MSAIGRAAALHIAFWQYDPWYRRAWFVWPQVTAMLLAVWLLAGRGGSEASSPAGDWAKPVDCTNPSLPGCAATRHASFVWDDEIARPMIANQVTISVDRSNFRNSALEDQPKLVAALGAYYRYDWAKAIEVLKSAAVSDPNVQYLTALALLVPNSTDQTRNAETLLREAAAGGVLQANSVLGRILFVGAGGVPKDEAAGRKLIDDAVAAGDPYAMRLAAAGYVSGEFGGTYDTVKAVDLLRRAAEIGGDAVVLAQLAFCINTGRGGLTRDTEKTIEHLRRAADAGFESAQIALARWFRDRYGNRESTDLPEAIKWYERSYQQGHSIFALGELAVIRRFAREAPWFDTRRSAELLQLCVPYRNAFCHFWLARAYHDGAGVARDYVKAYAYYTVAKELGWKDAFGNLQKLDDFLQPDVKSSGAELAKSILAGLKPIPRPNRLEFAETESRPSP